MIGDFILFDRDVCAKHPGLNYRRFGCEVLVRDKDLLREYPALMRTVCMEISRELKVTSDRM